MSNSDENQSLEIKSLEEKLDALILLYNSLRNENSSLKTKQDELIEERAKLIEKTSLAKTRVEAMITRLKSMEQGS